MSYKEIIIFMVSMNFRMIFSLENHDTLKMVHLVYRHGARSPIMFYPTNPYQAKDWPDGAGRLTQIGMGLEYDLGKFLKDRYVQNMSFIDSEYLHKQVYIRSSNSDRCLQSAATQLAGLYPPSGRQVWNKKINNWQPVPIQTIPKKEDALLRPDETPCPRYAQIREEQKKTTIYKEKERKSKELMKYLTKHAGMDVTLDNSWILVDDYLCEKAQGFSTPKWMTDRMDELLDVVNWKFLYQYSGDDEVGRILGGTLLGHIEDNMVKMSKDGDSKLFRMNIFSGHDTSIMSLAAGLNIDLGEPPNYAACFMIELYSDSKNHYFVEMKYRNDSSGSLVKFSLNGCGYRCPLVDFIKFTKNRVTQNQKAECGITDDFHNLQNKYNSAKKFEHVLYVAIVVLSTVIILLVFIYVWCFCLKNKKNIDKYIAHEDEKDGLIVS